MKSYKNNTKLQSKIKSDKVIADYSKEELEFVTTPIGYAAYRAPIEHPSEPEVVTLFIKDKKERYKGLLDYVPEDLKEDKEDFFDQVRPNKQYDFSEKPDIRSFEPHYVEPEILKQTDRMKCKICNKTYGRSNITHHNRTNYHKMYLELATKIVTILQPDANLYPIID